MKPGCHAHEMERIMTEGEQREEGKDHQPPPRPHLTGEEVGRDEDVHMETNELLPGRGLLPLRGGWDAVALEHIADGLVAHPISKIVQGPHNPIIAPGTILSGHTHHQGLQRLVNAGTSKHLARL
jgi:hypothetical protein